ncbi:MAG TPA: EAL domain-containing protein [Tepidiformaceae bacterium]|nr:EAL domain-containing protein [Tepidiformaceae bacterium]
MKPGNPVFRERPDDFEDSPGNPDDTFTSPNRFGADRRMSSHHNLRPHLPLLVLVACAVAPAALTPIALSQLLEPGLTSLAVELIVAAIAAGGALFVFHQKVSRPLAQLASVLHGAADGKFEGDATAATVTEIDRVARAYNQMSGAIQESTDSLVHRAFHDPLTGLPNRALFLSGFSRALGVPQRNNRVAVLFLDVDRFKYLNDTLGHGVGDQLLSVFSQRLVGAAEGQMVARLGGDEFTVLVQSTNAQATALRIAERIMHSLHRPFSLSGHEMFVSSSIGIAVSTANDRTSTELLRKADIALYRAKGEGRARYILFTPEFDASPAEQFDLDNALRRSVDRHELLLHYQPIVDLRSGDIAGMEALLRWDHPHRGILSPATFISIAEDTGEIIRIGQWVLEEACRRTVEFQRLRPLYPLTVSVNISAAEFRQRDLPRRIARVLEQTGLPPKQLKLELTESFLIQDIPVTLEMLGELRELGVGLAIDDFGTGYSSLSYLQRLPVDTLKVDQSFIARLGVDATSGPVLRAIVEMGNALKMNVVAEGIENSWQWDFLYGIGCKQGQGHLFKQAVDGAEFSRLVAAHQPLMQRRKPVLPRVG